MPEYIRTQWSQYTPLLIFLMAQSFAGVWWASTLTADVKDTKEDFYQYVVSNNAENLRIRERVYNNEDGIRDVQSTNRTAMAILSRVESNVATLKSSIEKTNELLREVLSNDN